MPTSTTVAVELDPANAGFRVQHGWASSGAATSSGKIGSERRFSEPEHERGAGTRGLHGAELDVAKVLRPFISAVIPSPRSP